MFNEFEKISWSRKACSAGKRHSYKNKAPKEEYVCYNLLEKIYHALNNNEKAYVNYKLFIALRDSVEDNSEIKNISEIEFNYEKEKTARRAINNL